MHGVWRDVRFGVGAAIKNPVFTLVVTLTLGLGIGANTAIFSVVNGILLRPLPFPEPNGLVTVWADVTARGGPLREWLSYPDFHDIRQEKGVFEEVAVWGNWTPTLNGAGSAQLVTGSVVSHGMFSKVLRVSPLLGRGFIDDDDKPDAENVVVMSYGLWNRVFGGDSNIVNRRISLSGEMHTVIGVMPRGFQPPFVSDADVWKVFQIDGATYDGSRESFSFRGLGRIRKEATLARARAQADIVAARLEKDFPASNTGKRFAIFSLRDDLTRNAQTPLWVLMSAVGFLLLIACFNIANLLLARLTTRQNEMAVRVAMGAGARRLTMQLLTENAVLALAGGALGVAVAYMGTELLVAMAPPGTPRLEAVSVDLGVLIFAVGATFLTTLAFGLLPAMRGARVDLHEAMKMRGRGTDGSGKNGAIANAMIVGQVSLALVLLVGAGLMLRSLRAMNAVELGFEPRGVLTLTLNLPRSRYPDRTSSTAFFQELEVRLGSLPGVEAIGTTNTVPLSGRDGDVTFYIERRSFPERGDDQTLWLRRVTPTYFATVGTRIVRGRGFARGDDDAALKVIIINETLAQRFFPEEEPIGKRININSQEEPVWREIVGIAEDTKNFGVRHGSRDVGYVPFSQSPTTFMAIMIRTHGDPNALGRPARTVIAEMDPALAASELTTLQTLVRASLGSERFVTLLLVLFASLALALAAIGLYGVVSYGVSRREHEIGIRIALGAAQTDIRRLIVRKTLLLTAGGVGLGLVGGLMLTRAMDVLVFGVSASDPITFGAVAVLLTAVSALASAVPAHRASKVDPITALKIGV